MDMNKFESLYERFEDLPCSLEPEADFSLLCMLAGVRSVHMDNLFSEYVGISGASVLRSLHDGIAEFCNK